MRVRVSAPAGAGNAVLQALWLEDVLPFPRGAATCPPCLVHPVALGCKAKWRKCILLRSGSSPDPSVLSVYLLCARTQKKAWVTSALCRVLLGLERERGPTVRRPKFLFRGSQPGPILPPRGHLLMSRLDFVVTTRATGMSWVGPRGAAKLPPTRRTAPSHREAFAAKRQ